MKCPHCLVSFHAKWTAWSRGSRSVRDRFKFKGTLCPECKQQTFILERGKYRVGPAPGASWVTLEEIMVYPKATARGVPPEVPEEFADDFREACLVIGDSEKASAALGRRCLQNLLLEKAGVQARDLANQIQEVIDSGKLPLELESAIDAVRAIGNFAAHPIKSKSTGEVLEVEPGEADWILDTLEELFDFYFVRPAKLAQKRVALNKKLKEAGKPPLKGSRAPAGNTGKV